MPADMSNCIPNSGFQVRVGVKQRIKVAARAAGSIRAANARASQLRRKINDDQQETVNPINQLIQHGNDKLGGEDSTISIFWFTHDHVHCCSNNK